MSIERTPEDHQRFHDDMERIAKSRSMRIDARQKNEEVVCEYRGRIFTRSNFENRFPIIHYFEDDKEYGLVATEPISEVLDTLKRDIDHRDGI